MCAVCAVPEYCITVCYLQCTGYGLIVCCLQGNIIRYNCMLFAVYRYTVKMCCVYIVPVYGIKVCCFQFTGIRYKCVVFAVCLYSV